MVKANELRIGNWVYFSYDYKKNRVTRCCKTLEISKDCAVVDDKRLELSLYYDSGSIQPIPLTSEILYKAGFKRGKSVFCYFYKGTIKLSVKGDYLLYKGLGVYYLHQLQNLYFALIGEELKINL